MWAINWLDKLLSIKYSRMPFLIWMPKQRVMKSELQLFLRKWKAKFKYL